MFKHPICIASGPWSHHNFLSNIPNVRHVAAIFTKTITLNRIEPTTAGQDHWSLEDGNWLNKVGLVNNGFDLFVEEELPLLLDLGPDIFVSLAGTETEVLPMVKGLKDTGIAGVELNFSCPNRKTAWFPLDNLRKESIVPIISKHSQNHHPSTFEGPITLGNSLRGAAVINGEYIEGGLSGVGLFAQTLFNVKRAVQRGAGPVIACGGIDRTSRVKACLDAGAIAVQIGSAHLSNPSVAANLSFGAT